MDVPLTVGKRPRGRPRKPRAVGAKKRGAVVALGDVSFECLRCGCRHGPDERLPVYCTDCFDHLHLFGYSDPTEDLAVVHYVYWGQ